MGFLFPSSAFVFLHSPWPDVPVPCLLCATLFTILSLAAPPLSGGGGGGGDDGGCRPRGARRVASLGRAWPTINSHDWDFPARVVFPVAAWVVAPLVPKGPFCSVSRC